MNVRADVRAAMRPRSMGLLLVMAAHVALGWLVMQGLGLRISLPVPEPPFEARMLPEQRTETQPPRPVAPRVGGQTKVDIPRPELPPFEPEVSPPLEPDAGPIVIDGDVGRRHGRRTAPRTRQRRPRRPLTQPPYPAASVRFGEEGTVTLELRVARDGRVLDARVLRSSGFPRLDAAAIEEARRVWWLRPATEDGSTIEASYAVRVSFRLDRR
jgi:protein TonB